MKISLKVLKLLIQGIANNPQILRSGALDKETLTDAASGDLESLKTVLVIYHRLVDYPRHPDNGGNFEPITQEYLKSMEDRYPVAEWKSDIQDIINALYANELEIIK